MRNDVKLGFAIGGVLLAVLVVYVLVVPGSGAKKVALNSAKPAGPAGNVSLEPVAPAKPLAQTAPPSAPAQVFNPTAAGSADSGSAQASADEHPAAKAGETPAGKDAVKTDPFASAGSDQATPQQAKPTPAAKVNGPDWDRILNDQPTLIAQAPVKLAADAAPAQGPAQRSLQAPTAESPTGGSVPADLSAPQSDPPMSEPLPPPGEKPIVAPPSQDPPAAGGGRVHTVQSGETFSSIAAAAYGSANFYPAIMRANPSIDPQHLKPGMKITLPDSSQVKPSNSAAPPASAAGAPATKIDSTKQYRVQPGDSLYRIAIKLYGKGTFSTKLFELNQQAMGGDETRLRPGQVLQLPEPPTQPQQ